MSFALCLWHCSITSNLGYNVIGCEFDDDPARVDADAVWEFTKDHAYWGKWRRRELLESQIANSWRARGVYISDIGEMVGFGRAISEGSSLHTSPTFMSCR